ncbi:hypothetical protein K1T71_008663 [Dendrolimus kikuchii]|uniref:Uncharacterized protein n=1 Tax=Dendrolimus kikuchii TaxID=765133 RepID=A0ACC1CV13_9NEOP|nr:hypothetical protein K1T71_008663 [Dendrolimus kikuchii]
MSAEIVTIISSNELISTRHLLSDSPASVLAFNQNKDYLTLFWRSELLHCEAELILLMESRE